MEAADRDRWQSAWAALGATPPDDAVLARVLAAYDEPHRAYHTREHLNECFVWLERVHEECDHPAEVTLALYFHDAVYDPHAKDNEAKSADWLDAVARAAGAAPDVRARLRTLIMATRHDAVPAGRDAVALVDCDLAILGAPPARFAAYERQVRREYRHVPGFFFRRARKKILREFLERDPIYGTAAIHAACEAQARVNLARSLSA